jgi:hypothetical protein
LHASRGGDGVGERLIDPATRSAKITSARPLVGVSKSRSKNATAHSAMPAAIGRRDPTDAASRPANESTIARTAENARNTNPACRGE